MNKGGAPKGNKNGTKGRIATAALHKALAIRSGEEPKETTENYQALIDIWDKQIANALEGSQASANMIVERLEGKATQAVDIDAKLDVIARNASELTDDELAQVIDD